jgi:hypothetical protein
LRLSRSLEWPATALLRGISRGPVMKQSGRAEATFSAHFGCCGIAFGHGAFSRVSTGGMWEIHARRFWTMASSKFA